MGVYEFYGILSFDVDHVADSAFLEEEYPSPSIVPRIHCLAHRPLHSPFPLMATLPPAEASTTFCMALRTELLAYFTSILQDALAAEYLLLQLLSRVNARLDGKPSFSYFSLCIIFYAFCFLLMLLLL